MDTGIEEDGKQGDNEEGKKIEENFPKKIFDDAEKEDDKRNIYIQYRIINNHGIMTGDDAKIESITIKDLGTRQEEKRQKYIFEDVEEFNNWLKDNYESYAMALMIAVATFDSLPYMWVVKAADILFQSFDKENEEEKRYGITDILSRFGAEICQGEMNTYTGKIPVEVVHLIKSEYQEKILKFVWKECPQFRDNIIQWLKKYSIKNPVSMTKRAIKIMEMLACCDYYYFLNSMVSNIHIERSIYIDMITAQIVVALSKEEKYKENIYSLLNIWSKEHRVHYLLTALFVCLKLDDQKNILENIVAQYVHKTMVEIQNNKYNDYSNNIYDFFAVGLRAFTYYRILIEKIYELSYDKISPKEKRNICELFLRLFAVDINLANLEKDEDAIFIKLCMVNHAICYKIQFLWQMVWQCRYHRQTFYYLMAQYDKKACRAGVTCNLEKFVYVALGDVCAKEMCSDICNKIHRRARND